MAGGEPLRAHRSSARFRRLLRQAGNSWAPGLVLVLVLVLGPEMIRWLLLWLRGLSAMAAGQEEGPHWPHQSVCGAPRLPSSLSPLQAPCLRFILGRLGTSLIRVRLRARDKTRVKTRVKTRTRARVRVRVKTRVRTRDKVRSRCPANDE